MDHENEPSPSKKQLRAGRIASGIAIAFLLWDSAIKLVLIDPVVESFDRLGFPASAARGIGLLELACALLYVAPRTAPLGAALLTGFLGGAVAIHARIGDPVLTHSLFPVYVGLFVWGGLVLRDRRLLALLASPTRRAPIAPAERS